MAVHISKLDETNTSGKSCSGRRAITVTGEHRERLIRIMESEARPTDYLRDSIAIARAARK